MNNNTQLIIAPLIIVGGLITAAFLFNSGDGPTTKKFNIVMKDNRYNPSEIIASVGDKIIINFENRDPVSHGGAIPQFNATVPGGHVPAGELRGWNLSQTERLTLMRRFAADLILLIRPMITERSLS